VSGILHYVDIGVIGSKMETVLGAMECSIAPRMYFNEERNNIFTKCAD